MKIAVIGTGYVGLVGGTCFAESGNDVLCVDNNQEKLAKLRAGEIPIYEPGLEALFLRNTKENRLTFSDSVAEAVDFAEIIFLALPTPPMEDGSADLQYVLAVAEEIGKSMKAYRVIVNKSTVPVGTADKVTETISKFTEVAFDVVSNPEFLREGAAVNDFMKPERVVIGTQSERAQKLLNKLYKPFVMSGNPIIFMDERSSELTKYASNSMLATKISFMNEIANLCERVGANVDMVRHGVGADSRIGKRFLFAGVGYGGSCFPKDVSALYKTARSYGYEFQILDAVMNVNKTQKHVMVEKLETYYGSDLSGLTFAMWGLAFKPNTDDIREAPALTIIKEITSRGGTVKAFDPEAMWQVREYTDLKVEMVESRYDALDGADALLIVTEWNEFRAPNFEKIKSSLKSPVIFDGRNIYDLAQMKELGFYYNSIGRGVVSAWEKNKANH
ncbi:MAG TPA: UDP-glucose/GDP-mannose dehydrogenase family protein [Bacteroidetes bacterium]|nr:UDP-glucose/GDP-mannose dehydrogenase family protein [Bacteroidota bacterium]